MDYGTHAGSRASGIIRSILSWAFFFVSVLALIWLIQNFVARAYAIPSGSMENTIEIGDQVWSEKISYYLREPAYGDIITFDDPEIPGRTLIKRVIATPGQTVDLIDGVVYVDGTPLDEPYTDSKPSVPLDAANDVSITYPYTVPAGSLWVMGDNRTSSSDSRYFGPIKKSSVSGRAFVVYWPLTHLGVL